MENVNSDLIRGNIDTIILKCLHIGDMYGLEICNIIKEASGGTYILKQPTLYSALKRLEQQRMISSYWRDSAIGGRRHYYKLTDEGKVSYKGKKDKWEVSKEVIDTLVESARKVPDIDADTENSENDFVNSAEIASSGFRPSRKDMEGQTLFQQSAQEFKQQMNSMKNEFSKFDNAPDAIISPVPLFTSVSHYNPYAKSDEYLTLPIDRRSESRGRAGTDMTERGESISSDIDRRSEGRGHACMNEQEKSISSKDILNDFNDEENDIEFTAKSMQNQNLTNKNEYKTTTAKDFETIENGFKTTANDFKTVAKSVEFYSPTPSAPPQPLKPLGLASECTLSNCVSSASPNNTLVWRAEGELYGSNSPISPDSPLSLNPFELVAESTSSNYVSPDSLTTQVWRSEGELADNSENDIPPLLKYIMNDNPQPSAASALDQAMQRLSMHSAFDSTTVDNKLNQEKSESQEVLRTALAGTVNNAFENKTRQDSQRLAEKTAFANASVNNALKQELPSSTQSAFAKYLSPDDYVSTAVGSKTNTVTKTAKISNYNIEIRPFVKHFNDKKSGDYVLVNKFRLVASLFVTCIIIACLIIVQKNLKADYSPDERMFFIMGYVISGAYFLYYLVRFIAGPHAKKIASGSAAEHFSRLGATVLTVVLVLCINVLTGLTFVNSPDYLVYWVVPCVLALTVYLEGLVQAALRKAKLFVA